MSDHERNSAPASDPAATDAASTEPKQKSNTPLVVTIIVLVAIIVAGAIAAALGVFSPADEPVPDETPVAEETVEPEPEPEPELVGFATPETWCTAVRHTPSGAFPDSPSFIWWATVLRTDDGELAAEGTEFEITVPDADVEPLEAVVREFGVLDVFVPISTYQLYELLDIVEVDDGRVVPGGPFVQIEVTESEFGPECEGPEEPALDDLVLGSGLPG